MLKYRNPISVAAHRGNSKYCPENTLAAFKSAMDLDPDMLEIDLHMTKDGEIIMMHDHTVDRTTNGSGLIREKTLAQMQALDAGSWKGEAFRGEKVPTFAELITSPYLTLFHLKSVPGTLFLIRTLRLMQVQVSFILPQLLVKMTTK